MQLCNAALRSTNRVLRNFSTGSAARIGGTSSTPCSATTAIASYRASVPAPPEPAAVALAVPPCGSASAWDSFCARLSASQPPAMAQAIEISGTLIARLCMTVCLSKKPQRALSRE